MAYVIGLYYYRDLKLDNVMFDCSHMEPSSLTTQQLLTSIPTIIDLGESYDAGPLATRDWQVTINFLLCFSHPFIFTYRFVLCANRSNQCHE
jgi:hypothetical protein